MIRPADRLVAELSSGARSGASALELAEVISRFVAPLVAHDGLCLVGTSPAAGIGPGSFSFWHGYDADFGRSRVRGYYSGADPCPPEDMAAFAVPAAVVDCGAGVELRWLLRDARGVWGGFTLLRERPGRPFDRADVDRVAGLGPMLIAVLRGFVSGASLTPVIPRIPAGAIIVGPDNTVRAATQHAVRWRDAMFGSALGPDWLAEESLLGLATLATDPRGRPSKFCMPLVVAGRWVAMEAQSLGSGEVAVVVQAATGEELLPMFSDWYGITAREREVVGELCDGAAPKQVARRLGVSVHTVNDHLKAVFRKTGAGCRSELISALNG